MKKFLLKALKAAINLGIGIAFGYLCFAYGQRSVQRKYNEKALFQRNMEFSLEQHYEGCVGGSYMVCVGRLHSQPECDLTSYQKQCLNETRSHAPEAIGAWVKEVLENRN